jgi:hypothetical protein
MHADQRTIQQAAKDFKQTEMRGKPGAIIKRLA